MTGVESAAGGALAKAILNELAKPVMSSLAHRVRVALGRTPEEKALKEGVRAALSRFARIHPDMTASFFDAQFLSVTAPPVLVRVLDTTAPPTGEQLATTWATQFGEQRRSAPHGVVVAAGDFLDLLRDELRRHPKFQALFDSRAFDVIASATSDTASLTARAEGHLSEIRDMLAKQSAGDTTVQRGADAAQDDSHAIKPESARQFVLAALTEDQLGDIVFDHFRPVFGQWSAGMSRSDKVRRLVEYADLQGTLGLLVNITRASNPTMYLRYTDAQAD